MRANNEAVSERSQRRGRTHARRGAHWRRSPAGALVARLVLVGATGAVAACGGLPAATGSMRPTVYRWGVVGNDGAVVRLERHAPTRVAGILGRVVQIATSNSDGYALTASGEVYGWGVNSDGELGQGRLSAYAARAMRIRFPAGVRIVSLANPMPFDAALALDARGHAWSWGLDVDGDLCTTAVVESRPRQLPIAGVTLVSGARSHTLLVARGTTYACGSGVAGELGVGSAPATSTPMPVIGLPRGVVVTALTTSWEGSGALLANGDYYDWGYNAAGQLGDGTTINSAVPVKVALPGPVARVFQGGSQPNNGQTIAVLKGGAVFAWGDNRRGQLGTGTRTNADIPVPVRVPRGVSFVAVSSGGYTSYAIDSENELWAWGDNRNGQLGTGAPHGLKTRPVKVGVRLTAVSATAQNVSGLAASPG